MFTRLARLSSLHSDKVTEKKLRMILTVIYSDIPPRHSSSGQASLPAQAKSSSADDTVPQAGVTYTLLSVRDMVSASLDMLCCSLSLALVAGAKA